MFEATITPAVVGHGHATRPIDWCELVARFAAARDLRALDLRPVRTGGSFAGRAEAGLRRIERSEPRVNLAALGGVKAPAAISAANMNNMAESDQGTQ